MTASPEDTPDRAAPEISIKHLLVSLSAECRVAACDLDRVQQVIEHLRRATPAGLSPDQIVLMQEIDRLTQTLAAIGRAIEVAHNALPAEDVDHLYLRQAAGLDSLFHRVVTGNSASTTARHQDPDSHTTLF